MLLRVVTLACALAASPALAFDTNKLGQRGSLPLDDLSALLAKSAQLQREVDGALREASKTKDDVMCDGMRFPGPWKELGGSRVGPYTCNFGSKWLKIETKVRVTGRKGKVFDTVTPAAMKNATDVTETTSTWKWTNEEPK
jgi:hypothetical protein